MSHATHADHPAAGSGPAATVNGDAALWSDFTTATTMGGFCHSWLALQCKLLDGVRAGMVLIGAPDQGPFRPMAIWPDKRRNLGYLTNTAQRAISRRRGIVLLPHEVPADGVGPHCEVAYPLEVRSALHGTIVLDVEPKPEPQLHHMLRQLHWGAGWLELLLNRERLEGEIAARERVQSALDLVATGLGHDRLSAACMSFVTALATKCHCDRVSVGFTKGGRTEVKAVSHSAEFKQHTNLLRSMAAVMDEAIDQRATIVYPAPNDSSMVARAHAELSRQHASGAICTVPLVGAKRPMGALTLERPPDRPFDAETVHLCQTVAAVMGPIFEVQRRDDRWLPAKAVESCRHALSSLLGAGHVALKVTTAVVVGVVAFAVCAQGDYRVSATTVLEPVVQRAAVAPFDGYVREAPARAGDLVKGGQLLCTLDDRDLTLERLKALGRAGELQKEYQKALSEQKASQVEIVAAQLRQAEAQIALYDDQLSRTQVIAPFDGIVVSGDLSQELGSPVEKGKVLFEVAPLDAYRVIVEVDERDIADVRVGQTGTLMLSAFPTEQVPFTVEKVTPVSTAKEGRNFFRVEARFDAPHDRLRPSMEGVGKIDIDRRRMTWIWTHQVADWGRLAVWNWLP